MTRPVDVCLLLEGTYPYVAGGVSSWVHDTIKAHPDLSFHLVTLLPRRGSTRVPRYELPGNVAGISHLFLQDLDPGVRRLPEADALMRRMEPLLLRMVEGGGLDELAALSRLLRPHVGRLGQRVLLNSFASWSSVVRMYQDTMPESSFLDYFWTWRSLFGGLFAVMLHPLPPAGVYHCASTGYAGLLGARVRIETGRPLLVTEHGIYTNERRIELSLADWLFDGVETGLSLDNPVRDLRRMWVETFVGYSRACYGAADKIITLYGGNQPMQLQDGADPTRMRVIPNGIDIDRFAAIPRDSAPRPPTIALIGRVVPIKDVKTFIRACFLLREQTGAFRALIMGPTEEDEEYFHECRAMVDSLGLADVVVFTGRVRIDEYLGGIDVLVLTSISEAQPLVILEAGAAGVPTVATDVGACSEMLLGAPDEDGALGPGGMITGLSNPAETAQALAELLNNSGFRQRCADAIRQRVRRSYNKADVDAIYGALYREAIEAPAATKINGVA